MKLVTHALILTAIILTLNLSLSTMVTQDEEVWRNRLEVHQQEIPFSLRPMTTSVTAALAEYTGMSVRDAFVVGQYPLVFALLLSFAVLLRAVGISRRWRIVGMWVLGLSFPILCVHFIPNYSWDDLWSYLGLTWMTVYLIRQRFFLASLCLLFAVVCRESALMTLPAFLFFRDKKTPWSRVLMAAAIPVVYYLVFRTVVFPDVHHMRFEHYLMNFGEWPATRQSVFSLLVSFGWVWVTGGRAVRQVVGRRFSAYDTTSRGLAAGSLVIGVLCIVVTMISAAARESRLFFVPFMFLIPLAIMQLRDLCRDIAASHIGRSYGRLIGAGVILLVISVLITVALFPSFPFLPMIDFHRTFFAVNLAAAAMFLLLQSRRIRQLVFPPR